KPETRLQQKKIRKHARSLLAGRVAALIVALIVFAVTGIAYFYKSWVDRNVTQVKALDENSKSIQHPEAQHGDENFLIVGSDSRAGANRGVGAGHESPGER